MKMIWKKHVPMALLQTCVSSATVGFRLTVHKADSFRIDDERLLQVHVSAQNGEGFVRELQFDERGTAYLQMEQLQPDVYTLSISNAQGEGLAARPEYQVRYAVDQVNSEDAFARFSLQGDHPFADIEVWLSGALSNVVIHVMEESAWGQTLPHPSSRHRYELIGAHFHTWVELHEGNGFEQVIQLPYDVYTIQGENEPVQLYVDDQLVEGSFVIGQEQHAIALIETREAVLSMVLQAFVENGQGVLVTPEASAFSVRVKGTDFDQTLHLNEIDDYKEELYDLPAGTYELYPDGLEGYACLLEVNGVLQCGHVVELQDETLSIRIIYQYVRRQEHALRIQKLIRGEGGSLQMPDEGESFCVRVSGCGANQSFYLRCENNFCVELADLCPGCYCIQELNNEGYSTTYELADGTRLLDGCFELCPCESVDVRIINEQRNNGKLQLCKYVEDENGNLTTPSQESCYAVKIHSFAYQETIMLRSENDFCVALSGLPKGCYDIRETEGSRVLYSVDQGEWSRTARLVIDDACLHEVRILNLEEEQSGTIRVEKWMENDYGMRMHPESSESFLLCLTGNGVKRRLTLNAQNQWCVYVEGLAYGEYRIEELYEPNVRYIINGQGCTEGYVSVGRKMQEVLVINPLPHATALKLGVQIINCENRQVTPDADFAVTAIVEGDHFCKEITLDCENRWRAILTDLHGNSVRVRQKDNLGYHVYYQVDGCMAKGANLSLDGKTHEVCLIDQYRHCQGMLCVEKRLLDGCGCLQLPKARDRYSLVLCGADLEVPFELNAANHFCVCFDDLHRGTYHIRELNETPCTYRINGQDNAEGCVELRSEDVNVQVINALAYEPTVSVSWRVRCKDGEIVSPCALSRFALSGQGIHRVFTLDEQNQFQIVLDDLQPGTYEIIAQGHARILFQIDGCLYEKGVFCLDQQDVQVVLLEEETANTLVLEKQLLDDNGAFVTPPANARYEVEVQSETECRRVWLEGANHFTAVLYDLTPGEVRIRELGQEAQLYVNGEAWSCDHFYVDSGEYQVVIVNDERQRCALEISGLCKQDDAFHECEDETITLLLEGEGVRQPVVLKRENGWTVWVEALLSGTYTLTSQRQNVCFYLEGIQSFNQITIELQKPQQKVQAVLQRQPVKLQADFRIRLLDAENNPITPPPHAVFTVRVISKDFFETLVFNEENAYQQTRRLSAGSYEMFAKGPFRTQYDYTLVNDVVHSITPLELKEDAAITFVFRQQTQKQGVLYVQGYRRDASCDCLKPPFAATRILLRLNGAGNTQTIELEQSNRWRSRVENLAPGSYTLSGENGQYSYIVDGQDSAQAQFTVMDDTHHIKVIDENEARPQGSLIIEKWLWNGEDRYKPDAQDQSWVRVEHGDDRWRVLLEEGNHFMASLLHLKDGIYRIYAEGKENVWYEIDGHTPSREGVATITGGGEVTVNILEESGPSEQGALTLQKVLSQDGVESVPVTGSYTFVLSKPGYEETIVLNAENAYRYTSSHLPDGQYVLEEQGSDRVTYRVNGGSEVSHAILIVNGSSLEVTAIDHPEQSSAGTLRVQLEQGNAPTTFLLQKPGAEYVFELNAENGYQMEQSGIANGHYAFDALHDACFWYALDDQDFRHYCSIRFADDAHTVRIMACPNEEAQDEDTVNTVKEAGSAAMAREAAPSQAKPAKKQHEVTKVVL